MGKNNIDPRQNFRISRDMRCFANWTHGEKGKSSINTRRSHLVDRVTAKLTHTKRWPQQGICTEQRKQQKRSTAGAPGPDGVISCFAATPLSVKQFDARRKHSQTKGSCKGFIRHAPSEKKRRTVRVLVLSTAIIFDCYAMRNERER